LFYKLFCAWRVPPAIEWRDVNILCLGLDGAGKSSLLVRAVFDATPQAAEGSPSEEIRPTSGFHVRTVKVLPWWKLLIWDIGGAAAIRPYWTKYVTTQMAALIWVVDASDAPRLEESRLALSSVLAQAVVHPGLPLLVFANKSDASAAERVSQGLRLAERCANRQHHVQPCDALSGAGIAAGLDWLKAQFGGG